MEHRRESGIGMRVAAVVILVLLVVVTGGIYLYINGIGAPLDSSSEETVSITIPQGAGTSAIGSVLEENGVIGSAFEFKLKSRIEGSEGKYKAGTYELSAAMSMDEIMNIIVSGTQNTMTFTVPEGYTLQQIAEKFEETGNGSAEDFLDETENGDFSFEYNNEMASGTNRYEGFLYPDTYEILDGESAHDIIQRMLSRFEEIYGEESTDASADSKYSVFDLVTVASIIEREVKADDERPLVASVIYNRLDKGMKLQMCSTVQYALGTPKARLTYSDLEIDSPYNTYQNEGLPAGPIASPGQAALSAALHPADTDYLYFVLTSDGSGKHNFAATGDDFSSYRDDYLASLSE